MPNESAQRTDQPEDERSFSNKPTILADNGHGTKVKLWNNSGKNGDYQNVTVERSFKREGSDQWKHRRSG